MKQFFLSTAIMLSVVTSTFAKDHSIQPSSKAKMETRKNAQLYQTALISNDVSELTKKQFATDFPDARNVRFERTKNFDEVSFWNGKKKLRAYYDSRSALVGTTENKTFADLPENAQEKIKKDYPGFQVLDVILYDDNEDNDTDMVLYGTTFMDADNYFVELKKGPRTNVLKVDLDGNISFFKSLK